jgi:hypothetical protein
MITICPIYEDMKGAKIAIALNEYGINFTTLPYSVISLLCLTTLFVHIVFTTDPNIVEIP